MEKDLTNLYKRGNINDFFFEALDDFQNRKIHFHTFYFIVLFGNHQDKMEKRIYRRYWKKLRFLMKFFSFDGEAIKLLLKDKL
jgi:hypothetical protein